VLGLAVALSALWMTLAFPRKEGTGDLLYVFRLLLGSGMAALIVLGLAAIRRRDIARHRA
jgi:NO-binding membrane sensor protein with MHYT domain